MTKRRTKKAAAPAPVERTRAQRLLAHIDALNPATPIQPKQLCHLYPPGDPAWAERHKVYLTWSPHGEDARAAAVYGYDFVLLTGPGGGALILMDNVTFLRGDQSPEVTAYLERLLHLAKGETP